MYLDTVPAAMPEANAMYAGMGFVRVGRYNDNLIEDVVFFGVVCRSGFQGLGRTGNGEGWRKKGMGSHHCPIRRAQDGAPEGLWLVEETEWQEQRRCMGEYRIWGSPDHCPIRRAQDGAPGGLWLVEESGNGWRGKGMCSPTIARSGGLRMGHPRFCEENSNGKGNSRARAGWQGYVAILDAVVEDGRKIGRSVIRELFLRA